MNGNSFNAEIGHRIRQAREDSHYTREVLAEKANISIQFLADIETGRKSMTIKTLKNISQALNVTSDYIIFGYTTSNSPSNLSILLENMSPTERSNAEELLKVYIKAISDAKNSIEENK